MKRVIYFALLMLGLVYTPDSSLDSYLGEESFQYWVRKEYRK